MKLFFKILFWLILIAALLFCLSFILVGILEKDAWLIGIGIFFILVLILFTIAVLRIVKSFKKEKIAEIKQKEYIKQYVEKREYTNQYYGKIIIVHDLNRKEIEFEIKNINFDGKNLDAYFILAEDADVTTLLEKINNFCNNAQKHKDRIYSGIFKEFHWVDDTYDENGNAIVVTEEYLRENFKFFSFYIEDGDIITLHGAWEKSGDTDIGINYNYKTDEYSFEIL